MTTTPSTTSTNDLPGLCTRIRRWTLSMSTAAGSGHPTSSLSAVEAMVALLFTDRFHFSPDDIGNPGNDRLIFSKGHASPLTYALWAAAGAIDAADLKTFRDMGSPLEGHPTFRFPLAQVATGSLGQGLAIGCGMAYGAKHLEQVDTRTFVLLGDSEMAEGSQWEAFNMAAHYGLTNLTAILDMNRLGQRGETMFGHDASAYADRARAFGWKPIMVDDGHDVDALQAAYDAAFAVDQPALIIARTLKGKGVSFLENADGWHGKPLDDDQLEKALDELGCAQSTLRGTIAPAQEVTVSAPKPSTIPDPEHPKPLATRKAYGEALVRLGAGHPKLVVLDAEVSNSTYAEKFKEAYPERFIECFVAEQVMAGMATGLAARGFTPYCSTFAAFLTRAFDQLRMSRYSGVHMVFCGSHAGVSIGEDGPSQMGLEDIAMFRSIPDSTVLYPADAYAAERLTEAAASAENLVYIRTSRPTTPLVYDAHERFSIGGCKVLRSSGADRVTLVGAGVTLFECLRAADELEKSHIHARVIDLYSVKPLDAATLLACARETGLVLTVEDHGRAGGIYEAVASSLAPQGLRCAGLYVDVLPMSATGDELLQLESINATAIVKTVKELL